MLVACERPNDNGAFPLVELHRFKCGRSRAVSNPVIRHFLASRVHFAVGNELEVVGVILTEFKGHVEIRIK